MPFCRKTITEVSQKLLLVILNHNKCLILSNVCRLPNFELSRGKDTAQIELSIQRNADDAQMELLSWEEKYKNFCFTSCTFVLLFGMAITAFIFGYYLRQNVL